MTPCILVTGGAGFIGSHFVQRWVQSAKGKIVNLDKLTYAGDLGRLASLADIESHVFVHGDICDRDLVSDVLGKHHPWAIVHLAAETHVDRSIVAPDAFLKTNIDGTFSMLSTALAYFETLSADERNAFRFLHVSTDEVFGSLDVDKPAFHEHTPFAPNSPYAASKAASDHLVRAWIHTYGLPAMVTNCSNNYGPWQFPEKLLPLTITNALAGKPLPIYGDGLQERDWLYVLDHCIALERVLERGRPGQTYNVGGGNRWTNLAVVTTICELLDELVPDSPYGPHRQLIRFVEDRPGHDRRYAMDIRKMENELGWRPEQDFEAGLRKTVEWHLQTTQNPTYKASQTPATLAV